MRSRVTERGWSHDYSRVFSLFGRAQPLSIEIILGQDSYRLVIVPTRWCDGTK